MVLCAGRALATQRHPRRRIIVATNLKTNRISQLAADQKFVDGTNQFLSHLPAMLVGSQTMTMQQIVQVFQDRITTGKAAVAAEDARKAAVKADHDQRAKTAPFVHAFKRIVTGMFLQSPDTLGAFGLSAPRIGKKKAVTKALAADKASATKKARGPIGKKQRALVKAPAPTAGDPRQAPSTTAPSNSPPGARAPAAPTAMPIAPVPSASPVAPLGKSAS
jgi:hypothetical protein